MALCTKFIGIKLGDKFSSYQEVKDKIHQVQDKSRVPLLLRDCLTLHGAVKKRPNIANLANPALVYHSLHYICIWGRKDTRRTKTYIRFGISPEYFSGGKEKCGAGIKFGLSKDYQQLEVKRIVDIHNHKISQHKRKRSDEDDPEMNAKRGKLDNEGTEQRGKIRGRRIAFKHLLEEMYSTKNASCEVLEYGIKPMALYFQTEEMGESFASYPEVLIIDSGYMISALRVKVHTLLNADGNGHCKIVGFCFAMEEDPCIVSFLMETFIKLNPRCSQTKSIMLDHPLYTNCLKTIMCHFTTASFFMCYHFSLRAYQAKIMRNPVVPFQNLHERDVCTNLFREMALAKDEKSYYEYFHRFKLYSPQSLFKYFVLNWHRRKEQWVDCMKDSNSWFLDQRRCKLETISSSVTELCNNYKSVRTFFPGLLALMASLRSERKKTALNVPVKGPIIMPAFQMAQTQYQNFLTPYAFSLVKKQIQSSFRVKILDNDDCDQCTIVSPKYGEILCTPVSCPCMVFTVIGLPCCHIFAVRNEKGMHGYERSLCNVRWSLQYLRKNLDLDVGDIGLVQDAEFGITVLPQYAERCQSISGVAAQEAVSLNGKDCEDLPFVPSSVQGSSNALDEAQCNPVDECVEEVVIDEVDPDGDMNLYGETDGFSGQSCEVIDWADMLGTL